VQRSEQCAGCTKRSACSSLLHADVGLTEHAPRAPVDATLLSSVRTAIARLKTFGHRDVVTEGSFGSHVALLSGGAALGQALTVLVAPAITRLYEPADLGRLGVFTAFVALAGVIPSLRYEMAIVTASGPGEAARLITLCGVLVIPVSVICTAVLFLLITKAVLGMDTLPVYSVASESSAELVEANTKITPTASASQRPVFARLSTISGPSKIERTSAMLKPCFDKA